MKGLNIDKSIEELHDLHETLFYLYDKGDIITILVSSRIGITDEDPTRLIPGDEGAICFKSLKVDVFCDIMREIDLTYAEYPGEMTFDEQREVALRLTGLEMEHESREKHGERQAEILGIAIQLVTAYRESLKKTTMPFPSFDEFMSIVRTAIELVGIEKEENPAEPMPELQG